MPLTESEHSGHPSRPEEEPILVAPSLEAMLTDVRTPQPTVLVDGRVVLLSVAAMAVAVVAALIARLLTGLIGLVTNLAYYGRFSTTFASPAQHHLGPIAVVVPAIGGIITEKIARRGVRVPAEYTADYLDQVLVGTVGVRPVVTLKADSTLESVRNWMSEGTTDAQHQGYPIVDDKGALAGVVTRRDLQSSARDGKTRIADIVRRTPSVVFEDSSLREAADHMLREGVGRLPVVSRSAPDTVIGIITRSDLLAAHGPRLHEASVVVRTLDVRDVSRRKGTSNGH